MSEAGATGGSSVVPHHYAAGKTDSKLVDVGPSDQKRRGDRGDSGCGAGSCLWSFVNVLSEAAVAAESLSGWMLIVKPWYPFAAVAAVTEPDANQFDISIAFGL